ncbi:GNAT family N-acetyltransferase [Alteribacter lacisalsi]|uniref:GNAT family N-acetyltransferase n=1 Tax=Alteribacter lacisalsi TaxID=2045244 RepID=UPI002E276B77
MRQLRNDDYEAWLEGFTGRSDSQYRHDTGRMDMTECTEDWFEKLVEKHRQLAADDTAYIFFVFHKDGRHLGHVDFSTLEREEFQWARIGYAFHNQHWGNGYAAEAVTRALETGFRELGYHRIEAHINLDNPRSMKLAERAGMTFECTRKGFIYEFGEWTDNHVYCKNAEGE